MNRRAHQPHENLETLLDRMLEARRGDEVRVGDVLQVMAGRSTGALVAGLGLIALVPVIGGIPGVSITVGALVLAVLMPGPRGGARGRGLWTPGFVRRRAMSYETFHGGIERSRPLARRVDRHLRPRLRGLAASPTGRLAIRIACLLLALSMFPLAVVPWGVTAPAAGLVALGLAMMTEDGLPALIGFALAGATVGVMIYAFAF